MPRSAWRAAAVGSGVTALTTLMHEAGHAAHFANIAQRSPLFSQERAPTSVAYAEKHACTGSRHMCSTFACGSDR